MRSTSSGKFSTTDELQQQVQEAVTDELIKGYRRYRLKAIEVAKLADFMEQLGATTVVGGDHIQAAIGDVTGKGAVGKGIIQTGDISAVESAVAIGHEAFATFTKYVSDFAPTLDLVLTALLITILVPEMILFMPVPLLIDVIMGKGWGVLTGLWWGMAAELNATCCAAPVSFPVFVLSALRKNPRNVLLSLLVGALAIGTRCAWDFVYIPFWFRPGAESMGW